MPLSSLVRSWFGYWAVNLQAPDWWSHSLWRRAHITQEEVTRTHKLLPPISLYNLNGTKIPLFHLLRVHLHLTGTQANALSTLLMTADVGTVIRVPVTYPPDHSLFAAAQMADDGRRVLHGTNIRAGLGIISGGFNGSEVGPGSRTLTKKFAANGSWAEGRSPRVVYSTTLETTAEVYQYFALKHYADDCLLPDMPITVARVAAQLAPRSLLVRLAPT